MLVAFVLGIAMEPTSPTSEILYQQALQHFERAEWNETLAILETLRARGFQPQLVDELAADVMLKQRLTSAEVRYKEPPKPRRKLPVVLIGTVGLAVVGIVAGALAIPQVLQGGNTTNAAANALATQVPATAPAATAVPPSPTLIPPTAAPPPPTAAPMHVATEVASPVQKTGFLQIKLPASESKIVRYTSNIELILDGSGSMLAKIGDQTKIDIARQAVSTIVNTLPAESHVALRTYGTQQGNDCNDLTLVAPLAKYERPDLLGRVAGIQPVNGGMTPISASLEAARGDLQKAQGSTALILVSDGEENCNGNPLSAVKQLISEKPNLRVHVIGFAINEQAATERLRALAQAGGGSYFDASDTQQLKAALQEAVQLRYQVRDEAGQVVGEGGIGGNPLKLPVGTYQVVLPSGLTATANVTVPDNGAVTLELSADGAALTQVP